MKHIKYFILLVVVLVFVSCASQPKVDPRSTYTGTIQKAIELLEKEEYTAIFTEIAHPDDIRELKKDGKKIEELVDDFRGKSAEYLLAILKIIKDREPIISNDGTKAEWTLTENDIEKAPSYPIIFEKLEGKWYIRN